MSKVNYLYTFSYKSYTYYYTNSNKDVIYNGVTYKSMYLSHSAIVSSMDEIRSQVSIFTDIDNPIVQLYMNFIPTSKVDLTIVKLKNNVAEYLFWGNVLDFDIINDYEAEIRVAPITSQLDRIANRFTYQSNCCHFLYDVNCGVQEADYSFITTVTEVSDDGKTVTVNDISKVGITDQEWLIGGKITVILTNSAMKILGVNYAAKQLLLLSYFPVNVGDEVKLSAGCNKTSNHCINKFNNLHRQNAEEFVPGRNPTTGL